MKIQSIPPTVPEVGPPKIGTIADLALNPILLLIVNVDEAVEVDGGVLEDPRVLEDGRRVLVATVLPNGAGAFPRAEYCTERGVLSVARF